jgi:thioredoxin-like negative regulator of GroEL
LTLASLLITAFPLQAQNPEPSTPENPSETPTEDLSDPNNLRPLTQSDSILSLKGGQKLMSEAKTAIEAEQYEAAAEKLQKARQVFNQLSNFYFQLFDSFSGIDNRIAEGQRKKALETGQLRDEATYQLALVHRAQNQPELSVPLLIQVIRSQNPTSDLGRKAYQQLFEIGFVEDSLSTSNSAK